MSRIDDDRSAQRAAERIALEKRQQEERTQKRQQGESAFARLVSQGTQDKGAVHKQQQTQLTHGKQVDAKEEVTDPSSRLNEEGALHEGKSEDKAAQAKDRNKRAGATFGDKLQRAKAGEGERASEGRFAELADKGHTTEGRTSDQRAGETRSEARREDARAGRDALGERGESALKGGLTGRSAAQKGDGKADADAGGQGQKGSGGQKKDDPQANLGGGFRFNPALMAPVPVAKPKDTAGSDRLRALANEIAQKIVERVRVGTNAAGASEFQIDLRSNVLKGLSIKVSGGNGKISAVFSGNDREVLKLLEEHADGLKQALSGRGLKLEELRIEERA